MSDYQVDLSSDEVNALLNILENFGQDDFYSLEQKCVFSHLEGRLGVVSKSISPSSSSLSSQVGEGESYSGGLSFLETIPEPLREFRCELCGDNVVTSIFDDSTVCIECEIDW